MTDSRKLQRLLLSKVGTLSRETPYAKGVRAELRKAVGKDIKEVPDVWPFLYEGLTEDELEGLSLVKSETALLDGLAIYSVHFRNNPHAHTLKSEGGNTVGGVLRNLRAKQPNPEAFDKKVSALLGLSSYPEIYRRLSTLLRQATAPLDYSSFVWDLYLLQTTARTKTLHRWGKDFYRRNSTTTERN